MGVVRGSRKANPEKKRKFEKKTIPIGIRVLINYSIIVGFFYLLFGIVFPATTIFGKQAEGYYVSITNILIFLLAILMIIGFYKKKYWSWKLALVLYSFSIFNSIPSIPYSPVS